MRYGKACLPLWPGVDAGDGPSRLAKVLCGGPGQRCHHQAEHKAISGLQAKPDAGLQADTTGPPCCGICRARRHPQAGRAPYAAAKTGLLPNLCLPYRLGQCWSTERTDCAQGTLAFDLAGMETVRDALVLYRQILGVAKRNWAGEGNRHSMAFSSFGNGLHRELLRRAVTDGEELSLATLEQERLSTVARKGSQLQALCSGYYRAYRAQLKQA